MRAGGLGHARCEAELSRVLSVGSRAPRRPSRPSPVVLTPISSLLLASARFRLPGWEACV